MKPAPANLCGFALLLLGACLAALAQSPQPTPKLEARVTDLTGTLTAEQQTALEQKLAAFEARKGSQVVVLIVPTTSPEALEAYSIRVFTQARLGRKKVDDGAMLLVAKDDHALRIEVGYGLEGALTDATAKRIIAETITPMFQQGDFYGGINAGIDQMIRVIDGEPLPAPDHRWQEGRSPGGHGLFPMLFFAVFIGSIVLQSILGRTLGSLATAAGAGVIVWLAGYAVLLAALAGVGAFVFSLLSGLPSGRGWSSYPRSGGWGGGGFGGGFGGGGFGGGGGGFSGGGGGGGGGGASGRW
jgi:uncharacterized protein